MKSQSLPISEKQFPHTRREIYMNSIGRLRNKDVSCHIDQDRKRVLYEKKQITLSKILHNLLIKFQSDAFCKIKKSTNFTKNRQTVDTVFLPDALLNNDRQIIKSFRQKLSVGQIDRYISLNIPKYRSQSMKLQKSSRYEIFEGTTKIKRQKTKQKDIDSTYISKSIEVIKVKQHRENNNSNGVKIVEFDVLSKGKTNVDKSKISKSKSTTKRDVIHIKYSQFSLGSQRETPEPKRVKKQVGNYGQNQLKVNEFSLLDDPQLSKPKYRNSNNNPIESESFYSSSLLQELKELHSPNIGKNRLKNARLDNYSCGRKFDSINIQY